MRKVRSLPGMGTAQPGMLLLVPGDGGLGHGNTQGTRGQENWTGPGRVPHGPPQARLPRPHLSKPEMNYWGQLRREANGIALKPNKACDCTLWDPKYFESKGQENRTLLGSDFPPTPARLQCLE